MESALDFSNARYDPAAVKASGATTVFRYLANPSWPKALSRPEALGFISAGVSVAPNFETYSSRPTEGTQAGVADAQSANGYADVIGVPVDVPIFYSVDEFATLQQVAPYFLGVKSQQRRPVGIYGPLGVGMDLMHSGALAYVWVTNAASWSGFSSWQALADAARTSGAHVLQHLDHPLNLPGGYDFNEILKPFPRWGPVSTAPTPPKMLVTPMYHPALSIAAVLQDTPQSPARAGVQPNGAVDVWDASLGFHGGANGKPYFAGKEAAQLVYPNAPEKAAGKKYTIIATDKSRYSYPEHS